MVTALRGATLFYAGRPAQLKLVSVPAPPKLKGAEIRERFLNYFEQQGHTRLPSSSLIPDDPTVLLTIAGMLQFKTIFMGQAQRKHARATTTQKCIRTNDLENVGVTARHHSFFEMLGNFSFGDYFKPEAISMAWELSTKIFQIPPERIWVSVFEKDEEAFALWRDQVGVPEQRIKRMGAADNFWAAGPTGPCGGFIEFYNLVFMESSRDSNCKLTPLENKNIDTGLGLERMAQILQQVPNNYETDLILPILERAAQLAGLQYALADPSQQTALKVIGDHVRACVYLISDGVFPSNIGRGYVLRRLIRRTIMKGRLLGINDPFLPTVADVAISLSSGCDAAVIPNAERIKRELSTEEEKFRVNLDRGEKMLEDLLQAALKEGSSGMEPTLKGKDVFELYDTYGFPSDITAELAAAQGVAVEQESFKAAMKEQRQRSKDSSKVVDMTAMDALRQRLGQLNATQFSGYHGTSGQGAVVAIVRDGESVDSAEEGEDVDIILDQTPFYAESGGQIGDHGQLHTVPESSSNGASAAPPAHASVSDVRKMSGDFFLHRASIQSGRLHVGQQVTATVDEIMRRRARSNHTATHLLQAALKKVLGDAVSQQGSLVTFQRLRFDFNLPRSVTPDEIRQIEGLVNLWIQEDHSLSTTVVPLAEAKAKGAVFMAGERYADEVRVIDIPGVSMELCGGTHVSSTSQIGLFKVQGIYVESLGDMQVLSESGIASGVRRIEAAAGPAAVEYVNSIDHAVKQLSQQLKAKPEELPGRVVGLQEELRSAQKQIADLKRQVALASSSALAAQAVTTDKGAKVLVSELPGVDSKSLQEAATQLQEQLGDPAAVCLLSVPEEGKVSMVAAFSPAVVKQGLQ
eukprot:jgi/Astpho2/4769/Aster-00316